MKFLRLFSSVILFVFFTSCDLFSSDEDIVNELSYSGSGVETVTSNKNGQVSITSSLDTEDTRYELSFDFTLLNEEDGKPITGTDVHYTHLHDKILIYIDDPAGNFSPSLFWGTPEELADYFGAATTQKSKFDQNRLVISGTVTLGIVAGIFLVGVVRSYIGISKGIVKMSNHYTTGFVRQGEDYTLYCKTFTELGEMITDRLDIGMDIGNLIVTVATYQGGHQVLSSVAMKVGTITADKIIRDFYQEIISEGYMTHDEIEGGKQVAVKIFFDDNPSLKNLFAKWEISPDYHECEGNIHDGYRTSGPFALTENSYPVQSNWDLVVNEVMGPDYRVADWNDLVSFYESGNNLLAMLDGLGVTERGTIGSVTRNGNRQYSSWRYYFASRHEHNRPPNYLAHSNINNYLISLGSWDGERRILAIRN